MSGRGDGDTAICRNFCCYYNPAKNNDLACGGFLVLHRIMQGGRKLPVDRPARSRRPGSPETEELKQRVCGSCDFRAADCDFILTGGKADPCGGMVLLMHLVASGELAIDEIAASDALAVGKIQGHGKERSRAPDGFARGQASPQRTQRMQKRKRS